MVLVGRAGHTERLSWQLPSLGFVISPAGVIDRLNGTVVKINGSPHLGSIAFGTV